MPLLEEALLVAIRADPRVSNPQELPVAVPKQAPLPTGKAGVAPLQPRGRPLPALITRPTPLREGALLVAIRADPRASKPVVPVVPQVTKEGPLVTKEVPQVPQGPLVTKEGPQVPQGPLVTKEVPQGPLVTKELPQGPLVT
jgi:hypothetical protein